jgi:hypothetical protein
VPQRLSNGFVAIGRHQHDRHFGKTRLAHVGLTSPARRKKRPLPAYLAV